MSESNVGCCINSGGSTMSMANCCKDDQPHLLTDEATVALDNDSGTGLAVPENVGLTDEQIATLRNTRYIPGVFYDISSAATGKAYPMGFDVGAKSRDAEVAELKHKLFSAEEMSEMWHVEAIAVRKERDTALGKAGAYEELRRQADVLVVDVLQYERERDEAAERARHMTSRRDDILDQATGIEAERDEALEQVRALVEAGLEVGETPTWSALGKLALIVGKAKESNESNVGEESC